MLFLSFAANSFGQNERIVHRQEQEFRGQSPTLGRDLWFCVPQNSDPNDDAGKVFPIYVTSERKTVVNIEITGQTPVKKQINPGEVWSYELPRSVELQSSVTVEKDKAIHVWSNDADLSVYFMSRNPFTSDGMYVIPTIGWGKEYVVTSYSALIVDPRFDLPSEFAVVANQNNTVITVVPSQDVRRTGDPSKAYYKKGQGFTVVLQRGECVQFQTVFDLGGSELDFTGTVITSNNPIGVVGASVCPFIPADPYCDHIVDMLPPVRTWSRAYYTVPFAGRKPPGGDSFYLIGTTAGQVIFRNGQQYASIGRFEKYYRDDINEPSYWTSTEPFFLVQYINSATYGVSSGGARNQGDPAMVVVNGAEHFARKVVFQTPTIDPSATPSQPKFTNYVNVVLPSASVGSTTFDGVAITSVPNMRRLPIPNTGWEGIRIPGVKDGTHTVVSDTGVGVYIYGYSTDDSYAWAGALGVKTPGSLDTIPPVAVTSGECFCARVDFTDNHPEPVTKLSSYIIDSIDNMGFYPDPNFIPGSEAPSSFYEFCVLDSTKDAYLTVSIYDNAGNRTTVISEYDARVAILTPPITTFGAIIPGNNGYKYIQIENTGTSPFTFKSSELDILGGQYFFIDSAGADGDIPPGGTRLVKVRFTPQVGPNVQDTVVFGDECVKVTALLVGNGGTPDFYVGPYDFPCTKPTTTRKSVGYAVQNSSGGDVTITSVVLSQGTVFGYNTANPATNATPFVVPRSNLAIDGKYDIEFTFTPPGLGWFYDTVTFTASDPKIAPKVAYISGEGCAPQITSIGSTDVTGCNGNIVYRVPISNTGNIEDTIVSVTGTATATEFSAPTVEDELGLLITLPYALGPGDSLFAVVNFTQPFNASGVYTDVITVTNAGGEDVTTATLTANAGFPKGVVTKPLADLGTQIFGGTPVEGFVTFCNDGDDAFEVTGVDTAAGADPGFSLSNKFEVGGVGKAIPFTLQAGECVDIFVSFDPSVSPDSLQTAAIDITSTTCQQFYQANARVLVSSTPPTIQGFNAPATFSCTNNSGVVKVRSDAPTGREVIGITFSGPNPANFSYTGGLPIAVPSQVFVDIPIVFTPNPGAGPDNYSAYAVLQLRDTASGAIYRDSALITGIGQGVDIHVRSVFAELSSTTQDAVQMPITISVDKKNLPITLDVLNIHRIELVYEFNTDLLDIEDDDVVGAITDLPAGWTVDQAASSYDEANDRLNLALVGTAPLPEGTTRLGSINFIVTLTDIEVVTDFNLVSYRFLDNASQPLGACVASTTADSNFTLILRCGDATLQEFLRDGQLTASRIEPASPNPVVGNHVTLGYATRFEGDVTLTIFDELGKEVLRIVDHKRLPAGVYQARANISTLAPATYTYRLAFDSDVKSGRFVITR